ncbi:CGGC domain-containing protein [Desulfofundulus thermosubterraneus]|uniref:Predicted metal-binding protein n=1 Tax=Desulfofundulus thermosubterraneus DSM 16057 TaxID=1121432 RepID=A0A1M6LJ21_9FIRM|nr:CGGC domain-containing protein [Desulfofundulus thermosubterraneus]SHJ71162.1 Predicted metal-binding protein [Desulfofundulus thermosubterraneus DSM 16057]
MVNVLIVSCGSYLSQGYGCPGEWKCFKAARDREGNFKDYDAVNVVGFLACECPGRSLIPNIGCVKKNVDFDVIHLSTCMVNAWPACPYRDVDELAKKITEKFGVKVVKGTHDYA